MEPERAFHADTESWTILLVEDDSLIRLTTAEYLRGVGYNVIEAVTGEEAVTVCQTTSGTDPLATRETDPPLVSRSG